MNRIVLVIILCLINYTCCDSPYPLTKTSDYVEIILPLDVKIPDNGELNWKIHVEEDFEIEDIQVQIDGLYHENSNDLRIVLQHDDVSSLLFETSRDLPIGNTEESNGVNFTFLSSPNDNLSRGKPTFMSSQYQNYSSDLAVDGEYSGYMGDNSTSHTAINDIDPWWYIDLGKNEDIGSIRIYNREHKPRFNEIQVVRTDGEVPIIYGTYRLKYKGEITEPISYLAVGSKDDEVKDGGVGRDIGESMESKLESLSTITDVSVIRYTLPGMNHFDYVIIFQSETSDLEEIEVVEPFVELENMSYSVNVTVRTTRNGDGDNWESYSTYQQSLESNLFPLTVLFFDESINQVPKSLNESKTYATYYTSFDYVKRETVLQLNTPITARYVKLQLNTKTKPLTLAEVDIFSPTQYPTIENCLGSINRIKYSENNVTLISNDNLKSRFNNTSSKGNWLLSILDKRPVEYIKDYNNRDVIFNGTGGLNSWRLFLTHKNGSIYVYNSDQTAFIMTLPRYGKLYRISTNDEGEEIKSEIFPDEGFLLNTKCFLRCSFYNNPPIYRDSYNALFSQPNWIPSQRVVYKPNNGYVGDDFITYRITVGMTPSIRRGKINFHVRNCKTEDCVNDENTFTYQFYNPNTPY